jgi:hypothetical protein
MQVATLSEKRLAGSRFRHVILVLERSDMPVRSPSISRLDCGAAAAMRTPHARLKPSTAGANGETLVGGRNRVNGRANVTNPREPNEIRAFTEPHRDRF